MITRSKARVIRQAENKLKPRNATPTQASFQQQPSRVDAVATHATQMDQVLADNHDQTQLSYAEIEAALLTAIAQMGAHENQAGLAGTTNNQQPPPCRPPR